MRWRLHAGFIDEGFIDEGCMKASSRWSLHRWRKPSSMKASSIKVSFIGGAFHTKKPYKPNGKPNSGEPSSDRSKPSVMKALPIKPSSRWSLHAAFIDEACMQPSSMKPACSLHRDEAFMQPSWMKASSSLHPSSSSGGSHVRFRGVAKHQKSIGKTRFCASRFPHSKNLIKPVENEDFWAPFSKKGPKMIKNHYHYSVFATRFQNVQKLSNATGIQRFSKCKNALRKPL